MLGLVGPAGDEPGPVFSHQVHEALYRGLDPGDRRRHHASAAAALVALGRGDTAPEQVAHHLLEAGPGHAPAAVDASRRAARRCTAVLAHEDAVTHLERARAACRGPGAGPALERGVACDVLLELGRARWRADDRPGAHRAFDEAAARARADDDADRLAAAALGAAPDLAFTGDGPGPRLASCDAALAALGRGDSALRARVLAQGSAELLRGDDPHACRAAADEALAVARRVGDPTAVGHALVVTQTASLGPATLHRRLAEAGEIVAIAASTGDQRLGAAGHFLRYGALLEMGDVRGLDRASLAQQRILDGLGQAGDRRHALWSQTMRALLDGDAPRVEALAEEALAAASTTGDPDALVVYGGQLGALRWIQGRVLELEPVYAEIGRQRPHEPLWPAVLAWLRSDDGRAPQAMATLERLGRGGFADVVEDRHWMLTMGLLADTAATVGDLERGSVLYDRLVPFADRVITVGQGIACWGPAARPLGRLAAALGRPAESVRHLREAVAVAARMGARPWLVQAQLDLAEVLLASGAPSPEVLPLVAEARASAVARAMPLLAARAGELAASLDARQPPDPTPPRPAAPGPGVAPIPAPPSPGRGPETRVRICVLGRFVVDHPQRGTTAWTSRKARTLLQVLVARRGTPAPREVLMDVLWPDEDPARLGNRLSVALSAVRRGLDPDRSLPADALVVADRQAVSLRQGNVAIDVEEFLEAADRALRLWRDGAPGAAAALCAAGAAYGGDAFPGVTDLAAEPWARPLRDDAHAAFVAVTRAWAGAASDDGDHVGALASHQRLLAEDDLDEEAHLGVVRALAAQGLEDEARRSHGRYARRMVELDRRPAPFPTRDRS